MTKLSKLYFGFSLAVGPPAHCPHQYSGHHGWLDVRLLRLLADRLFQNVLLDFRIHHDREVLDVVVVVDSAERVQQGNPDALLEHAASQFVGNLEIESAGQHALRLNQVDEPVQLRSDAVVRAQP